MQGRRGHACCACELQQQRSTSHFVSALFGCAKRLMSHVSSCLAAQEPVAELSPSLAQEVLTDVQGLHNHVIFSGTRLVQVGVATGKSIMSGGGDWKEHHEWGWRLERVVNEFALLSWVATAYRGGDCMLMPSCSSGSLSAYTCGGRKAPRSRQGLRGLRPADWFRYPAGRPRPDHPRRTRGALTRRDKH